MLTDTEKRYDTFEKEALAIYWCVSELRQYMGDSYFTIEADHKPLENFHLKQINNKRVMNWLFKLQDIIPQIIEVKYRKGASNSAAEYLSRHFPHPASDTQAPDDNDDWPAPTESWTNHEIKPQRLLTRTNHEIKPQRSTYIPYHHNLSQLNAVTTRQQAKLFSHPPHRHSPQTTSTPSLPQSNKKLSPSQSYDFSIARIQHEQQNDIVLQRKIKEVKNVPKSHSYEIKDDLLYKLIPRGGTLNYSIYH
ncbi:unnamed protein product [Didymodactylos carnosus]|uniref:Reverse transcriptase RNase H-like domain-containing protein n=1 Tax=Didymodactylos carnosus TaxID=1234261 RepID=A0A816AUP7_9BILA|nr:unnamed protein product [Didymodactylos carnosus]CAF4477222.1 unnamed protein product [Didymodactylos carnosus]